MSDEDLLALARRAASELDLVLWDRVRVLMLRAGASQKNPSDFKPGEQGRYLVQIR